MNDRHRQPEIRDSDGVVDEEEIQDDQIIAVWLTRSLWGMLAIAGILFVIWWIPVGENEPQIEEVNAESPQSTASLAAQVAAAPDLPFSEQAEARGLLFHFENGAFGDRYLPETMVGGVAVLDFDQDGDSDLLLTGGNRWPFDPSREPLAQTVGLFENDGSGHFKRVDQDLGLSFDGYAMGAAVADYNGDGYPDLFLTALGPDALFQNDNGLGFVRRPLPESAAEGWSTAAAFFDADGDGWQDLLVTRYVVWNRQLDLDANYQIAGIGRAYGPPTNFEGSLPRLYRNLGGTGFEDVSEASGIQDVPQASAKSLAVATRDFDGDGDLDIFVANDTTANFLYLNQGNGQFIERGQALGVAFDNTGKATGAMGVDVADVMGPGSIALAVGNFANEMTSFFVHLGATDPAADTADELLFADDAILSGVGPASRMALTFGLFFADLDLDGYQDLLQVNGHVENEINRVQAGQHYRQPPQLFWHCPSGCARRYIALPESQLGQLATPIAGRGAAYADLDGDGDLDLVLAETGGPARLYINPQNGVHNWLRVRLAGRAPATEALGARVTLTAGGRQQSRVVTATRSYLSQTELVATFGLGTVDRVDALTVSWPDGSQTRQTVSAVNREITVRQTP